MRHLALRAAVLAFVTLAFVTTARAEPIQIYFQGTVGTFFGTSPPPEISPTEPFWGSFFVDPLAADLDPSSLGRFHVAAPFSLSIGSYTAMMASLDIIQEPLAANHFGLYPLLTNMSTNVPGAAWASGWMEIIATGNANILSSDPTLWVPLNAAVNFYDAGANRIWGFGGSIQSADVPEPMTLALVLSGVAIAGARKLRATAAHRRA